MSNASFLAAVGLSVLALATPALAVGTASNDEFCTVEGMTKPLRQTMIVIDGRLIVAETPDGGASDANLPWRQFALGYLDASQADINTRLDPRERVTIAVANSDGSGTTVLFSGCVPTFSAEEAEEKRAEDSQLGKFFGSSWQSRHEDMAKGFSRGAQRGLREAAYGTPSAKPAGHAFSGGSLVASLRRGGTLDLANGIPRVVIYTDLSQYGFPEGPTATDPDAFANVAKSAGATVSPIVFGDANHGKHLREILGLPEILKEPMISLYAHAGANATGAGSMKFALHYLFR